jgi:pyruvate kinase
MLAHLIAKQRQKGPEIRTGNTIDDKDFDISAGDELIITTDEKYKTASDNKHM